MSGTYATQIDLKGREIDLLREWLRESQGLFVTFFPHIDTPVSKFQLEDMRNVYPTILENGYNLVAITLEQIPPSIQELELPYPIIQDIDEKLSKAFKVLKKGLSGKVCLRRTFFVSPNLKAQITINDLQEAMQLITNSSIRWNALV